MIRHQFGQVEFASEQWFRLAASTLAGVTHAAGLATAAKPAAGRLRRVDLVRQRRRGPPAWSWSSRRAPSSRCSCRSTAVDQAELDAVARACNARAGGPLGAQGLEALSSSGLRAHCRRIARPADARSCRAHRAMMREFDAAARGGRLQRGPAQRDGGAGVRPEREAAPRFRGAPGPRVPGRARCAASRDAADVHVFIGRENGHEEMQDVSLVLPRYGRTGPGHRAWSACSVQRAWPTPRRSARSAT